MPRTFLLVAMAAGMVLAAAIVDDTAGSYGLLQCQDPSSPSSSTFRGDILSLLDDLPATAATTGFANLQLSSGSGAFAWGLCLCLGAGGGPCAECLAGAAREAAVEQDRPLLLAQLRRHQRHVARRGRVPRLPAPRRLLLRGRPPPPRRRRARRLHRPGALPRAARRQQQLGPSARHRGHGHGPCAARGRPSHSHGAARLERAGARAGAVREGPRAGGLRELPAALGPAPAQVLGPHGRGPRGRQRRGLRLLPGAGAGSSSSSLRSRSGIITLLYVNSSPITKFQERLTAPID